MEPEPGVAMDNARFLTAPLRIREIVLLPVSLILLALGNPEEAAAFTCNTKCKLEVSLGSDEPRSVSGIKNVDVASGWGGVKLPTGAAEGMLMLAAAERRDRPEFERRADPSIKDLMAASAWQIHAISLSKQKTSGVSGILGHAFTPAQFKERTDALGQLGVPRPLIDKAVAEGTPGLLADCEGSINDLILKTQKLRKATSLPTAAELHDLLRSWIILLGRASAVGRMHDVMVPP
jgi:hypothetical protein